MRRTKMMISFWERKNHGNDFLRTPKRGHSGEEKMVGKEEAKMENGEPVSRRAVEVAATVWP